MQNKIRSFAALFIKKIMIEVVESALQKAAGEGMDEFIQAFTDKYKEVIGGELTAETMPLLTGEQHSLLAYQIFRDEMMVGGFCQLIQNGYGGYIFDNPFLICCQTVLLYFYL